MRKLGKRQLDILDFLDDYGFWRYHPVHTLFIPWVHDCGHVTKKAFDVFIERGLARIEGTNEAGIMTYRITEAGLKYLEQHRGPKAAKYGT